MNIKWTMNYIEELENRIAENESLILEIQKRNIENAKHLGEAIGALKGILHNNIDDELKERINHIFQRINDKTHTK